MKRLTRNHRVRDCTLAKAPTPSGTDTNTPDTSGAQLLQRISRQRKHRKKISDNGRYENPRMRKVAPLDADQSRGKACNT
ncbi:hypothetical protein OIU85_023219 [Salix viminalis]|uniref:Uncharacterized protein n=1 Tax=Salix viminalis TaxID=40686 RepID=A0A9Q0Z3M2_SALVM|nr:hypothetical protein OIU85_023219 [Salix viminalis]